MARIIPKEMSLADFKRQRHLWISMSEIKEQTGLRRDSVMLRIRNYPGKVDRLSIRTRGGWRFRNPFYRKAQIKRALELFVSSRQDWVPEGVTLLNSTEAAHLLGYASRNSFSVWVWRCEKKPLRFRKVLVGKTGRVHVHYFYEKESLLECHNWFLQRKWSRDRLPVALERVSGRRDARSAGAAVWEHLGYSRNEYMNGL